jgi:hypothetical protein
VVATDAGLLDFPVVVSFNDLIISKLPSLFSKCSEARMVCTLLSIYDKIGQTIEFTGYFKTPLGGRKDFGKTIGKLILWFISQVFAQYNLNQLNA